MARPTHLLKKRKKAPGKPTPPKSGVRRVQNHSGKKRKMNTKDQPVTWEEVNHIRNLTIQQIQVINEAIPYTKDPEIAQHLDMERMEIDLQIAAKDIQEFFTPTLMELNERHKDRTGEAKDQDEIMEIISIFVDYQVLLERMESTLTPTYLSIIDAVNVANNKVLAARQVQDVTVVSDVEFKETQDD